MIFNTLKPRAHYVFNYKPRYYDKRKETLETLEKKYQNNKSDVDDYNSKKLSIYLSKNNLRKQWIRKKYSSKDSGVTRRLSIIITLLVGIVAYIFEIHKLF